MSENKRVGRTVAIVLGLLCNIFMGSTVGTVIYYNTQPNGTPDDNQSDTDPSAVYSDLIGQIEAANDTIADLTNQIADLEEQLANIDTTSNSNLAKQVTNLQAQLDIKNKTITQLTDYYNSLIYVLNTEVHDTTALLIAAKDNATALQT
jgi:septal ring factor EnvC (AmiA/AmiB activator)